MIQKIQMIFIYSTLLYWSSALVPFHTCSRLQSKNTKPSYVLKLHETKDEENQQTSSLTELLMPSPKCKPTQMSPTALAYIGDSVFELFVRSRYVWPSRRTTDLQNIVVAKVRAESQSILFQSILSKMELTTEEQTIVSRGRNAGSASGGRKRGPKRLYSSTKEDANGGPSVYQNSTAFEALIGYLYLTNVERCSEILEHVRHEMDMMDKDEGVVR